MIINGPFDSVTNFIEDTEVVLSKNENKFEIELVDGSLKEHLFFTFKVRQNPAMWYDDVIFIYVQFNGTSKVLPMKKSPRGFYDFIEYRVRIPSDLTTSIKIGFMYQGYHQNTCEIKDLKFSPKFNELDEFNIERYIFVKTVGLGDTSPLHWYLPTYVGDVIDFKMYSYSGYKIKNVEIEGDLYNEFGTKYPSVFVPDSDELKLKYINPFENSRITVIFERF